MTVSDIITNALQEIGALSPGETASSEDTTFCLNKLNRLFDNWNAESLFIYGTLLFTGTLTPNHNPHTIGIASSTPDFTVTTARPPRIDQANLVINDVSPVIYRPLLVVDEQWWMKNPVPDLATQIPYYLYPNYGWPKGELYLWPVPTKAYGIRLNLYTLFASMALGDTFTFPPGYEDAVTLSLAEALIAPYHAEPSPTLIVGAREARARVKSLNSEAPTMVCDGGVQSMDARPRASMANFLSGFFN